MLNVAATLDFWCCSPCLCVACYTLQTGQLIYWGICVAIASKHDTCNLEMLLHIPQILHASSPCRTHCLVAPHSFGRLATYEKWPRIELPYKFTHCQHKLQANCQLRRQWNANSFINENRRSQTRSPRIAGAATVGAGIGIGIGIGIGSGARFNPAPCAANVA